MQQSFTMEQGTLLLVARQQSLREIAAMATENLKNTMITMDAMKTANKELKAQYGKINVNKIEVRLYILINTKLIIRNCKMKWKICWSKQTR